MWFNRHRVPGFTGFCGFLRVSKYWGFHKTQTRFFLCHRIYRFNRGSGSGLKTLFQQPRITCAKRRFLISSIQIYFMVNSANKKSTGYYLNMSNITKTRTVVWYIKEPKNINTIHNGVPKIPPLMKFEISYQLITSSGSLFTLSNLLMKLVFY